MDATMARAEMTRRYEDVADGMQLAQLLARAVRVRVRAWLGGLPQGIEEWIAGLQLGTGRAGVARRLDAQRP
ncbi:MAG: hypothetical protein ACK2VA_07190 [Anaerolineae bacterium]|jgi:hypothetical protein